MKQINYVAAMLLFLCLAGYTHGQTGCTKMGVGTTNTGEYNSSFGENAGYSLKTESRRNSFIGSGAGQNTRKGKDNTFVGYWAGSQNFGGNKNTYLGCEAAMTAGSWNSGNVYLGYRAGYTTSGSNQLVIGNSSTNKLIYGEFDTKYLRVNGYLTAREGLYFSYDNQTDQYSTSGLVNIWGIRYESPVFNRVFSSKNTVLL
ncbi:MAG: hypothetical protein MI922_11805, partial [Bacteroidales bacterium]|nr:hypothetical protein [Bacteroidales bacterium]